MTNANPTDAAAINTDRELWREKESDYYAPSIHVTASGGIGINVGGTVIVHTLRTWHLLNEQVSNLQAFKDWVHAYLDGLGIPTHPDGPHSKEGCRIGDRMDILRDRLRLAVGALEWIATEDMLDPEKLVKELKRIANCALRGVDPAAPENQ
jgi:hypothetical protein